MTRQQAQREVQKRWGKKGIIRAYDSVSSPEKRAAAVEAWTEAKARVEAIDAEIKERLAQLDWYVALREERTRMTQQRQKTEGYRHYKKFSVGHTDGFGFYIEGSGDTWAEAFAEADRKQQNGLLPQKVSA